MVASVSALSSAGQAASYYETDDYYAEGGLAPSEWFGEAAKALGLQGEVDREKFATLLEGRVDGKQLGTIREGKVEHRPGWDITFSAPKSVSIMAEVAGDKRLIAAHGAAATVALAHVESHLAATRIRISGEVQREATGNLVVATFRHVTSRAQDPQLHTHAIVVNATQDKDGDWRSLEPRAFYQLQKDIGAIYRQELAHGIAALGYQIEPGKDAMFEIAGVPDKVIDALSQRTAAIDARLAERGTTRQEASAAEKQIAALDTREAKSHVDIRELRADWRATADANGFDASARDRLVSGAVGRARDIGTRASPEPQARQAVAFAAAKLSERESVMSASALAREAGDFAFGKVGHEQISSAITGAEQRGELVPRTFLDRRGAEFAGFTTPQALETERTMLRLEAVGRGMADTLASPLTAARTVERAARQSARSGYAWTDDQRRATTDLLTARDRIVAVQGYAGTAKTTTVLATYAREAERHGLAVTALAPTASAATVLGEALGLRGDTVARHLLTPEGRMARKEAVWIVDEASMLSAQDMAKLMTSADRAEARLVLVGDVKQLGSVGAGAAFAQLQTAGMTTTKLAEVVRQTNIETREAVMASIEGHAGKALAALDRGGGKVIEGATPKERFEAMVQHYLSLSPAERTWTLVIEPSRDGRDMLTGLIRENLASRGELSWERLQFAALEAKGMTRAEARQAASYTIGDVVRFNRDYAAKDVRRGEPLTVSAVEPGRGRIALAGRDGRSVDWHPRQWGAGKAEVFEPKLMDLRTGDRVQFTRNDHEAGRINGLGGTVTGIDPSTGQATLKLANGREQRLDLSDPRDTHLRHAYVQTAHAAQGQTAERVLIHADSRSTNLVDQKMLYVALSRARGEAVIVTDDRDRLVRAITERAGEKQTAMEAAVPDAGKSKAIGAGIG
ncbi:exonuclease V subunit alpha [Sphingopyxis lindanitolerans]|uniref:Exonuclease V subunit alpha n=1 Tax=Sphingopyxis lindanitolerans TaxID=2054227 RepID=A0A2S8B1T9_9SPHN|nr:MobF family relaxase [Sphingopyxis lindanitolerans]PQM26371.1 exonuclease V subunit alpha [Sphingopyxis lindanitolerans]